MQFRVIFVFAFLGVVSSSLAHELQEIFAWKDVEFSWPNAAIRENAIRSGKYIPENNMPLGLARWKDKLFVTIPRWKNGVAASLNYIPLDSPVKNPPLTPYPNWRANILPEGNNRIEANTIVSVFRVAVDACDRLWVMDTGLSDINGEGKQVATPALVIFDLNTDRLIRRYEFKPADIKEDTFFPNVVVDVSPDNCNEAFAYVPDLAAYGLVVYSFKDNDSWRIRHNYFHFDPLSGDFNVAGLKFQWSDGIFGLALSDEYPDGERTLYFHAMSSTKEFSVSTRVLKNRTIATDPNSYTLYKLEGERGYNAQATASDIDEKTDVMFMGLANKDAVACWNTNKPLRPENVGIIYQNRETMVFPNDLKIDDDRNLYVLSDKMPVFLFSQLNPNEVNYRIFRINVDDAIRGTVCEPF